jgi:hypothetical protein
MGMCNPFLAGTNSVPHGQAIAQPTARQGLNSVNAIVPDVKPYCAVPKIRDVKSNFAVMIWTDETRGDGVKMRCGQKVLRLALRDSAAASHGHGRSTADGCERAYEGV